MTFGFPAPDADLHTRDTVMELPLPPLTLQPQQPDFSSFDLTSALPPAYPTLSQAIDLPSSCSQYVGPGQECTANMTALSVQFEDCGASFTVCRCTDAEMSMDTVINRLGSVPVGLRRYAGTIVVLSDPSPHAYTLTTGDTHFFGDCAVNTWIHEMTHTFDFAQATTQSSAPGWAAALAVDSCVPDTYSLTNEVEAKDFAQVGVLKVYMLLHGGNLPPDFTADCMANQLAFMAGFELYDPGPLFGNNCDIIDTGPPARHTLAPAVLDPSRVFQTVSADDTSPPVTTGSDGGAPAASTARASSASSSSLRPPVLSSWVILLVVCAWTALR